VSARPPTLDLPPLNVDPVYAPQFTEVAPYYDRLMSTVPYRKWVDYLELLFARLNVKPQRILDLACGTGNVSCELARRGYHVTGLDASADMIAIAERKATECSGVEFGVGDLRSFSVAAPFSMVTCLYDSLNYLTADGELALAFRRAFESTRPEGYFIFDMNSVWALEQELFTQSNAGWARAFRYHWSSHYEAATQISEVAMQFRVREPNGIEYEFNELHYERAYPIDVIHETLVAAGWIVRHSFDAYTTQRARKDSERWFFVAQRGS